MSLQAYNKTIQNTEDSRQTEYRLFAEITREMIDASNTESGGQAIVQAVGRNRQLWQALATDCRNSGNQMPEQLRASIISLSIWVTKFSGDVVRKGADINDLVEVNRIIMKGLVPRANP